MAEQKDNLGHSWLIGSDGWPMGCCLGCSTSRMDIAGRRCDLIQGENDGQLLRNAGLIGNEYPVPPLDEWWRKVSEADLAQAAEKADEYGSADLEIMGKAMEGLIPDGELLDSESRRRMGYEMAIAFYHLGKAARTFGAYARGRSPSDDTWHDSVVYAMMVRRMRETGGWPQ